MKPFNNKLILLY